MEQQISINTYQELVSAFLELLTVAIHTILAERTVYPKASFLKARKWGLAVYQSRHPGVIKWVEDAVDAVEKEILKGTVRQTSLVIISQSAIPLERFVFSTASFPALPASDALTPFATSNNTEVTEATSEDVEGHQIPGVSMIDLAAQFRGLLSRICSVAARMQPLPSECSFTITIELRDRPEGEPPIGWPQPFIPSDPKLSNSSPKDSRITPVRNVEVGFFEMEAWIEETRQKLNAPIEQGRGAEESPSDYEREDDRILDPLLEAMEGKTYMK